MKTLETELQAVAESARRGFAAPYARRWTRASLVVRFTVVTLLIVLGVGLVGARVLAAELRSTALSQEADAVAYDATQRMAGMVHPADLQQPMTPRRAAEINRLVHERMLGAGTVGASLWRGDRVVGYSTDPSSVGRSGKTDEKLELALSGELAQEITSRSDVEITLAPTDQPEVMEIYVPLRLGGPKVLGAFEIYRDLTDVNRRIAAVQRAMLLTLGGGLALLFVALLLIVRGASRQMRRQSEELGLQAAALARFEARQEVNRRQTEFVGIVSHELRTPLTALLGFSELLMTENVADTDRREWTALLHSGAERLRHLVEQLLDVSRIDHARLELRLAPESMTQAVAEAMKSFSVLPQGIEITQRLEPDLPPVLADHEKLVQILTNLVSNAVKYSPDGGEVIVDVRLVGSSIRVSVSDRGLGIAPSEMARIFDRFHRVDDERQRSIEGTGLGLYITRQLVEMHGGDVTVDSLGTSRGSTFTVRLPIADRETALV